MRACAYVCYVCITIVYLCGCCLCMLNVRSREYICHTQRLSFRHPSGVCTMTAQQQALTDISIDDSVA